MKNLTFKYPPIIIVTDNTKINWDTATPLDLSGTLYVRTEGDGIAKNVRDLIRGKVVSVQEGCEYISGDLLATKFTAFKIWDDVAKKFEFTYQTLILNTRTGKKLDITDKETISKKFTDDEIQAIIDNGGNPDDFYKQGPSGSWTDRKDVPKLLIDISSKRGIKYLAVLVADFKKAGKLKELLLNDNTQDAARNGETRPRYWREWKTPSGELAKTVNWRGLLGDVITITPVKEGEYWHMNFDLGLDKVQISDYATEARDNLFVPEELKGLVLRRPINRTPVQTSASKVFEDMAAIREVSAVKNPTPENILEDSFENLPF